MGEVTPFTGGKVPAVLAGNLDDNDDLSSGIRGGYSVVSIRGSKWHIKADGEETTVTNADGDPVGSLRLVLLKASPNISKNFYAGGYSEGSSEPPTCSSIDGKIPDPASPSVQAPSCAVCPQNVIGSKVTDDGKKLKACSDSRRIAVIPENDFKNERYSGAMLLRVPASSLSNLSAYGKKMKQVGFPYNTIVTRCSFDHTASYPKIEFNAVRPLTDDEANDIVALLSDPEFADKIESVLAKDLEIIPLDQRTQPEQMPLFEEPPATPAAAVAPVQPVAAEALVPAKKTSRAAKKPVPVAAVASNTVVAVETKATVEEAVVVDDSDDELDSELKDILGSLDNLD